MEPNKNTTQCECCQNVIALKNFYGKIYCRFKYIKSEFNIVYYKMKCVKINPILIRYIG